MSTTRRTSGRNFFVLLSSFLFMFSFSSSVLATTAEIEGIKEQIRNKGAQWLAEETSITKLPVERRLKRVGFVKPLSVPEGAVLQLTLPVALSGATYLNYADANFVTPVKDQGDCGSSWAFATTAALESQVLMITGAAPTSGVSLAEEILLSCSGAGNCNGGYIDSASNFLKSTGLPTESCFPYPTYSEQNETPTKCSSASCPYWQSAADAITDWQYVATTSPTVAGLKTALSNYGPLVTTMNVYSDFYSYSGGVYNHVTGAYQGGHAIEITGYDDTNQCFIVKNSWGTGWGETATGQPNGGGFFRIAYSEVNDQQVQFGYYTIAYFGYKVVQNTCSNSISPESVSATYAGGYANVSVTSQSGCSWTAVSHDNLIAVVSGARGTGNGTVRFYVYPNYTRTNWTGTLTIAGETFTVTQSTKSSVAQR